MAVRAKMTVQSITDFGPNTGKQVKFVTAYDPTIPEDVAFTKATPYGEILMNVDNPAALDQLAIGEAFYVDFTPAT